MATVLANLTGDMSDIVDQDFIRATVRLRANTDYVVDQDNNKIRVLDPVWKQVAADGTFFYGSLIAAADTVVPGTLQYHLDFKVKTVGVVAESTLGPFVLAAGDQDVTDLEIVPPVLFNTTVPVVIDGDVLAAAEAYTDATEAAHLADPDPHVQYLRFQDVSGNPVNIPVIFARVGDPFPPVVNGTILVYGGS